MVGAVAIRAERNATLFDLTHWPIVIVALDKLVNFFILWIVFVDVVKVDHFRPTARAAVGAFNTCLERIPLFFSTALLLFYLFRPFLLIIFVPLLIVCFIILGLFFFVGIRH